MEQEDLTKKIIGCAMQVHQVLGPGFLESVYQKALAIELVRAGLQCECGCRIPVHYRGESVGDFVADVLVEKSVILELKANVGLNTSHEAQLVNYLHATNLEIGLLLNFGAKKLEIKRKHKTYRPKPLPVSPENPVLLSKKTTGFTILEVLVAVAVLGMLLVLLLNILQSAAGLWRGVENRAETYREARAAMQVIARDLTGAVASTNTNHFPTNLIASSHLAFFSRLPRSSQNSDSHGDVCMVGYFLAYGNKSPVAGDNGRQSYNLYRYFIESNETFTNLSQGSPLFPDFDPSTNRSEILARNVVAFDVSYLTVNGTTTNTWTQSVASPMPDLVEIQITAVNNERTMRFDARGAASDWESFAAATNAPDFLKHTKTFTTRLPLPSP